MTKRSNAKDEPNRAPASIDDRDGVDTQAREAEARSKQGEAALREEPEDKRDIARRTTPAGKGRSQ
jgi:hypothetical protein